MTIATAGFSCIKRIMRASPRLRSQFRFGIVPRDVEIGEAALLALSR
jgi:hypothetical protein